MKRFLSLFLSIVMLISITAGLDLSAYADETVSGSLSLDNTVDVNITAEGGYVYYSFTPSETAYYICSSTHSNDDDPFAYLYDSNWEYLSDDDDGASNLNFLLRYELTAGQTYYFKFSSFSDSAVSYTVKIEKSSVASISFSFGDDVKMIQGVDSYVEYDNNDKPFDYYDVPLYSNGNKLTLNYNDSTSETYVCNDGNYYCGDKLLQYNLRCSTNQYENHFSIGSDNEVTIKYMGLETTEKVTVVENPYSSFYIYVPEIKIKNTDAESEYRHDDNGNEILYDYYYSQYFTPYREGAVVTLTAKNGATEVYSYNSDRESFVDANGNKIPYDVYYYSNQYSKPWTLGSNNFYTVNFAGFEQNVPVTIVCNVHPGTTLAGAKSATCTENGYTGNYVCYACGELVTYGSVIPATGHNFGNNSPSCLACGVANPSYVAPTPIAPNTSTATVGTVKLSKTTYTYDGKVKKPTVTVTDSNGNVLKNGTDYTVKYAKGRKDIGKYAVNITFKGNYSGSKKLYFTIVPKSTSISSITAKSKGFTVKWKKQSTQTSGYQIQYSTSSKFTSKTTKTETVSKNSTISKAISKLTAKKTYYVRVRTYKTVKINGKSTKVYSAWSKVKSVKTK